jgi:replicative DNA helicase
MARVDYKKRLTDAEQSVVGAVFLDNNVFEQLDLTPAHFYDPKLKAIWTAMAELRNDGKPIDEVTLPGALGSSMDSIGYDTLGKLIMKVPSAANASTYADIVREGWLTRRVNLAAADVIHKSTVMGLNGEDLLSSLQGSLESILRESGRAPSTLETIITEQLAWLQGDVRATGLPIGLGLEKYIPGGVPRDKVTCIFADAGTFKTTLKNQILIGFAENGMKTLDISLEDSSELTAHRLLSRKTGVPYGRIAGGELNEDELTLVRAVQASQYELAKNIYVGDSVSPRIEDIIREARKLRYSGGLDAVCVDYIQLLDGPGEREKLNEAVRQAQLAAKRDKMAYIFLSQIKQDVANRENPRPRLQDMLGSSAMRTGAKLVIGLFRPFNHCPAPVHDGGAYAMYAKLVAARDDGYKIYENLLEVWIVKNVLGAAQKAVHVLVTPETGVMEPFDMTEYI